MTTPLPDDRTERMRTVLISGIVVLALVVVGLGAWAIFRPKPKGPGQVTYTPAEETTASASATSSVIASETTASQGATESGANGPSTLSSSPGAPVRAAKIAFLLGSAIFVADEDGTGGKEVVSQADPNSVFSLSPDGRTLAVVSGMPQVLTLVDVATSQVTTIPGAIPELPDWAPDSSWVAYTAGSAGSFSARRVNRDGTGDALLASPGANPEVSPDGTRVAYVKSGQAGLGDPLAVVDVATLKSKQVPKSEGSLHWAWATDGSLYFVQAGKTTGSGVVGVADASLSTARVIGEIPGTNAPAAPGDLYPSPNSKKVLLTLIGDDGYSRMFMMDVASGKVTQFPALPVRHDQAPLGWTLDGKYVLYVEGNAIQNDEPSLWRANADGTQPRMLVHSANL